MYESVDEDGELMRDDEANDELEWVVVVVVVVAAAAAAAAGGCRF